MESHRQMQQLFPVFNGDDYELWSIKMRTLLMSRDLWDAIDTKNSPPRMEGQLFQREREREKNLRMKDMSALYMLQMSVTDSIFFRIAKATSSKQAWELLKADFGETERLKNLKKGNLVMMYENLRMRGGESVNEFTGRVMEHVNRLRFYGSNISDEEAIFKILEKLPSIFQKSVSIIRSSRDFTITEVVEILRADERNIRLSQKS